MADNNNQKNYGIADGAKDVQKAAKGAKSTAKVGSKLVSGNVAGAFKEFLKNPGGVITTVVAGFLAIALFITCILGTLVNSIWTILSGEDTNVTNMVDDYMKQTQLVETKCFTKAYNYISDTALAEMCEKIKAENKNGNEVNMEIFKDKSTLQKYLGQSYYETRKYASMGKSFPSYEKIKVGEGSVLGFIEDKTLGYDSTVPTSVSGNDTTTNLTWVNTTHIIDYGGKDVNGKTLKNLMKKTDDKKDSDTVQATVDSVSKTEYIFNYNNVKFNSDSVNMSMLRMIFDVKYDWERNEEVNSPDYKLTKVLNLVRAAYKDGKNYDKYIFVTQVRNLMNTYWLMKGDIYYLNDTVSAEINNYVRVANNVMGEKEEQFKLPSDDKRSQKIPEQKKEEQDKAFEKFISQKNVYEKLLTYNLKLKVKDGSNNTKFPSYDESARSKIQNVKKVYEFTMDVNFCDYDTLAEIFGICERDKNGNLTYNESFLNYIYAKDNIEEKDNKETSSAASTVSQIVSSNTSETKKEDKNSKIVSSTGVMWPLNKKDVVMDADSKYGMRNGKFHKGIDFGAAMNAPIASAAAGKVVYVNNNTDGSGYGVHVVIQHKIGNRTLYTRYAHMSSTPLHVGNIVKAGQKVGYIGSTGDSSGPHLHFEILTKNSYDRNDSVDPMLYLEGKTSGVSVIDYDLFDYSISYFDNTLGGFFDSCKDAGVATAQVLLDAGYVQSSAYWQYVQKVYNVMFCSSAVMNSKLPFFVDVNNIARDKNGSLKITEYHSADYDNKSTYSPAQNKKLARSAMIKYNKNYYAVYCQPKTLAEMRFSAQVSNFEYEARKNSGIKDFLYGNHQANSKGGTNFIISSLPSTQKFDIYDETIKSYTGGYAGASLNMEEKEKIRQEEMKKQVTVDYSKDFTYLSYLFANVGYGFEVANLQITSPDAKNDNVLLSTKDYTSGAYITNKAKNKQTITEYMRENKSDSELQINADSNNSVILGNVVDSNLMEDTYHMEYDKSDPETYPFFVVSTSIINVASNELGLSIEGPELSEIFDLDVTDDLTYNDPTSGCTWPVIKSYEHINNVEALNFDGEVTSTDVDFIKVRVTNTGDAHRKSGVNLKISNITPTVKKGETFTSGKVLGTVADTVEASLSYLDDKGKVMNYPIRSGQWVKTVTEIESRSDMSLGEDSTGNFNKVVSMMPGVIKKASSNSVLVESAEKGLFFEYTGNGAFSFDKNFKEGDYISNGSVIGKLYIVNSGGKIGKLNVSVYKNAHIDANQIYDLAAYNTDVYLNPATFFGNIKDSSEVARKVMIKLNGQDDVLSSLLLNRNCTADLETIVSPKSTLTELVSAYSKGKNNLYLKWEIKDTKVNKVKASDKNTEVVSIDKKYLTAYKPSNGNFVVPVKAVYPGSATVICKLVMKDGDKIKDVAGISGEVKITVPKQFTPEQIVYKENIDAPKVQDDATVENASDSDYNMLNNLTSDNILELVMNEKTKNFRVDFNIEKAIGVDNVGAFKAVKWSVSENNYGISINEKTGYIKTSSPMRSSDYVTVTATSTDDAGVNKNDVKSISVKVRFVRLVRDIDISENIKTLVVNGAADVKTLYLLSEKDCEKLFGSKKSKWPENIIFYNIDPENATYQGISFEFDDTTSKIAKSNKEIKSYDNKSLSMPGYKIIVKDSGDATIKIRSQQPQFINGEDYGVIYSAIIHIKSGYYFDKVELLNVPKYIKTGDTKKLKLKVSYRGSEVPSYAYEASITKDDERIEIESFDEGEVVVTGKGAGKSKIKVTVYNSYDRKSVTQALNIIPNEITLNSVLMGDSTICSPENGNTTTSMDSEPVEFNRGFYTQSNIVNVNGYNYYCNGLTIPLGVAETGLSIYNLGALDANKKDVKISIKTNDNKIEVDTSRMSSEGYFSVKFKEKPAKNAQVASSFTITVTAWEGTENEVKIKNTFLVTSESDIEIKSGVLYKKNNQLYFNPQKI